MFIEYHNVKDRGSIWLDKGPCSYLLICLCVCSVEFVPRYIKTSGNATVDHLSKYLAVRLALEELRRNTEASPVNVEAASEKQYTIYIPTAGNQFTVSTPVLSNLHILYAFYTFSNTSIPVQFTLYSTVFDSLS